MSTGLSVVVTGASSGLGRAIALRLARDGWIVVAVGRSGRRTAETVQAIRQAGGLAEPVVGDVAAQQTHAEALAAATAVAPLGGWMNCAGITVRNSLEHLSEEVTRTLIETNQLGTLWGCRTAVSHWCATATPGVIVNMSSVHGRGAYPDHTVYEMTKAAIEALTRSVAVSFGSRGIRANTVAPGAIETPALRETFDSAGDPAAAEGALASRVPMKRIGQAGEVAAAVSFLMSAQSSYVNGQTLIVDGGWTAAIGLDPDDPDALRPGVSA